MNYSPAFIVKNLAIIAKIDYTELMRAFSSVGCNCLKRYSMGEK
jgi:hypothetical protein